MRDIIDSEGQSEKETDRDRDRRRERERERERKRERERVRNRETERQRDRQRQRERGWRGRSVLAHSLHKTSSYIKEIQCSDCPHFETVYINPKPGAGSAEPRAPTRTHGWIRLRNPVHEAPGQWSCCCMGRLALEFQNVLTVEG